MHCWKAIGNMLCGSHPALTPAHTFCCSKTSLCSSSPVSSVLPLPTPAYDSRNGERVYAVGAGAAGLAVAVGFIAIAAQRRRRRRAAVKDESIAKVTTPLSQSSTSRYDGGGEHEV